VTSRKRAAASSEYTVRQQWQDVARAKPVADRQQTTNVVFSGGFGAAWQHGRRVWVVAATTGSRRAGRATRPCPRRQPARRRRRGGNAATADGAGAHGGGVRAFGARAGLIRLARPDRRQGCADDDRDEYHRSTGEGAHHRGRDRGAASVSGQRCTVGGDAVRLSRRAARLDRRLVHGGLHRRIGAG